MAFNFIKKVFSFGRKADDEKPAELPAPDAVVEAPLPPPLPTAERAIEPASTINVEPDAPKAVDSFPHDGGAMQFTPETAPQPDLAPAEPEDRDHAGEPPIAEAGDVPEPRTAPVAEPTIEANALPAGRQKIDSAVDADASPSSPRLRSALLPGGEKTPDEASAPETETTEKQPPATSPPRGEGGEAKAEPGEGNLSADEGPTDNPAPLPTEGSVNIAVSPEDKPAPKPSPAPEVQPPASSPPRGEGGEAKAEPGEGNLSTDAEPAPAPAPAPLPTQVRVGKTVSREEKAAPAPVAPQPRASWWQRLRDGLSRSSSQLTEQVAGIFTKRKLDEETLQELEDVLIQADLGVETALRITDALSAGRYGRDISSAEVAKVMAAEITRVLAPVARPLELDLSHKPHVILVVGVNGTGKTTTIGKLAAKLASGGLKVTLAAGDTFRAAAIEQLKIWGERTGSEVVSTKLGADAAGLAYEALERARDNGSDVVIIDTAGRLQNRTELMDELAKVVRVIGKVDPEAPHTVLQTLDATTGQNALNQVEIFRNVAGVNGLVMTKLDGTARGGILVAIAARHKLPVYFIGVGEGVDDLEPFEASEFAEAIVGEHR